MSPLWVRVWPARTAGAHLLHQRFDVTLIDVEDRPGGHAHTHEHLSPGARRRC